MLRLVFVDYRHTYFSGLRTYVCTVVCTYKFIQLQVVDSLLKSQIKA